MRRNGNHGSCFTGWLLGRFAAEKKKAITTACLVIVMVFMWIKVLTRNTPEVAGAVPPTGLLNVEGSSEAAVKVSFLELPDEPGRNNVITRDFFASDGWRHFVGGRRKFADIEEVNVLSQNGSEEVIRKVAEKLRLEAIVVSKNPLTFINNKVLSVGDRMLISDGNDKYECEVAAIEENTVKIKCREAEITLKLVQVPTADH
ncbi:MAG: hypothetical protein JSW66_13275 [Phycisphaerales bacterium]|nr:MAG: hypothetical protein JSW66_13275 [Phycisphaerales bacterium]